MVTTSIVKFQRDFLDHGIAHLKPLVLKDVALDIGMHESTVSRATANKYVHTAAGHLRAEVLLHLEPQHRQTATRCRRRASRIASARSSPAEDARHPLSDQHIAEMLAKENVDIARRTVAKYREIMGILPSSKRRQVF